MQLGSVQDHLTVWHYLRRHLIFVCLEFVLFLLSDKPIFYILKHIVLLRYIAWILDRNRLVFLFCDFLLISPRLLLQILIVWLLRLTA